MKNGSSITTSNGKDNGANVMNLLKQLQKHIFTKRKLCFQSGEISKEFYILNCFQGIKPLIRTRTIVNWIN